MPGWRRSNLGMYRVQLAGQRSTSATGRSASITRSTAGIGVHHAAAIRRGEPFRVNVFVGGPPALTVAAVMPLPEGLPELAFAGALGGRRVADGRAGGWPAHAGRGRLRDHRHDRPAHAQARRPVRRPSRLLQPGARLPGAAGRDGLSSHGRHLAVHLGGPAAAGRHDLRRLDPRADRADHPDA